MRDEGDRFVAWRLDDTPADPGADLEEERMERALLAYAHRSAAKVGAEWFAAEFARREEEERLQEARAAERLGALEEPVPDRTPEMTLIDASVEDAVVGGAPTGLGLGPTPHPVVHPPPVPQPAMVEPVASEPAAPEPAMVEPATREPVAPQPAMVEQRAPEPAAPEPAMIESAAPEPVLPEPAAPEPAIPQPAMRHPHVPRPPAPEPASQPKRRRRHRKQAEVPTPSFVISAPEWARMSPGARRLYGLDASPPAAATG